MTDSLVLVRDGQPGALIILPNNPHKHERQAADEIAAYIKKISGAKLEIIETGSAERSVLTPGQAETKIRILVGSVALARPGLKDTGGLISAADLEKARGDRPNTCYEPDGFVLSVQPGLIALAGVRPEGTVYAAVELLERLGCRWFFPGPLGEVVPESKTISLKPFKTVQSPSFEYRYFWVVCFEQEKMREAHKNVYDIMESWYSHSKSSFHTNCAEYMHNFGPNENISEPALLKARTQKALDFFKKNPQAKRCSLGWADGNCDVGEEQALGIRHNWDKRFSASDALIAFYNKIAEKVTKIYPDKELGILVYMNYFIPPVSVRPHPALLNVIAPIAQCGRHIGNTGTCWERDVTLAVVKTWCEMSRKVLLFDYDPQFLTHGSMPVPCVRRLKKEMPLMHGYGLRGVLTCAQLSVMMQGANHYIRTKLLWNINADTDALLDEYYGMLFGPASEPVRKFSEALEDMMIARPGHQHEDEIMKIVYPVAKVRRLEVYVKQAEGKTNTDIFRRRVRIIRYCYDNMILYLSMRKAEDQANFAEAAGLARRMIKLHKEMESFDPTIYQRGNFNRADEETLDYLAPAWARQNGERQDCIDGTKGDLVAMLPETWQFQTDPHDEGIFSNWFRPEHSIDNWRRIKVTGIWEVQGLEDELGHGYDGVGWYRTEAEVPAGFAGRTVKLNFGGAFGRMLVWVNGRFVEYRPFKLPYYEGRYNHNFDMDITPAIEPGRKNTIIIRLDNEIDWGGLFRRLFLWSPK